MATAVFYISGHGFGHAARTIEIINALTRLQPDVRIVVRSTVAPWLLELTLTTTSEHHTVSCDTGMVQIDSLRLDEAESVRRADAFHRDLPAKARDEARFLVGSRADLVVGDIPPLAFAAAALADLPAIAIGNFTWDWIYASFPEHVSEYPALLPVIREAYRSASLALRLPMFGGFDVFGPIVRDIPLVARRSHRDPRDVRRWLRLGDDRPIVLISFGGHGLLSLSLDRVDARSRYTLLTTIAPGSGEEVGTTDAEGLRSVKERDIYAAGFRYEDLVAAADVVVTKPGYSIIAEAAANDAAVLYTSRGRFVEYDVLVAAMPELVRCRFIAQDDLFSGRWEASLDQLLRQPRPSVQPAVDGAEIAARIVQDHLR